MTKPTTIKLTLSARYSDAEATVRATPIGSAVLLSATQSDAAATRAGLASGDYWVTATDTDGNEYNVSVR